ncbi:ficolin-2-like [Mercenaria mercenaria]|uniref:ficolin-2-like n=1 Tax=Mercenaria mercenaria TaxID=6596 RepID=UPI00234E60FA|nr:ficolin-2-like [Mercenaria mercenaria]
MNVHDKHGSARDKLVPKGDGRKNSFSRSSGTTTPEACSTRNYVSIHHYRRLLERLIGNLQKWHTVYPILPDGRCPFFVYCDMSNGGWTLIQKRIDGRVSVYRSWEDYVRDFGDIDGSHWLGLEKIHRLTRGRNQIYFDMENYDGTTEYAHYRVFTVHEAATAYTMNVDAYDYDGSIQELLSYYNNMKFSTFDRENDVSSRNCALVVNGAS